MTSALVSDIPGRMRVRLAPEQRAPDFMSALEERLAATDGLRGVRPRPSTGSIVIQYDAAQHSRAEVIERLRAAGVSIDDAEPRKRNAGYGGNGARGAHNVAATRLVDAMAEANEAIARATGRSFDLRLLFPLALAGWGVMRLARNGLQLGEIPAYVLLWYAFDAFWKLNYAAPTSSAVDTVRPDDVQ